MIKVFNAGTSYVLSVAGVIHGRYTTRGAALKAALEFQENYDASS